MVRAGSVPEVWDVVCVWWRRTRVLCLQYENYGFAVYCRSGRTPVECDSANMLTVQEIFAACSVLLNRLISWSLVSFEFFDKVLESLSFVEQVFLVCNFPLYYLPWYHLCYRAVTGIFCLRKNWPRKKTGFRCKTSFYTSNNFLVLPSFRDAQKQESEKSTGTAVWSSGAWLSAENFSQLKPWW